MSKYTKGEPIKSFDVLLKQEFIYFCNKVYHRGWWSSWSVHLLSTWMEQGAICKAVRKDDK